MNKIDEIKANIESFYPNMTAHQYYDLLLKVEMVKELRAIYDVLSKEERQEE